MEGSWFPRSPSSKRDYELPRWRTPSPMAASMIPPPIVESRYVTTPRLSPKAIAKSVIVEKSTATESRESELQADLQFLLDAQAEGLIKGLEGNRIEDDISTGSTTPTAKSFKGSLPRQVNRPVRRKLGLRSARKGIYNTILALSAIKIDQLQSIDVSVREKEARLAQIDAWEKKRAGLQEAAVSVDASEETIRAQRLRQEADTLQEEINHVEIQLAELKTRHRRLLKQAASVENAVQAKIASYTSSLSLLETDIKRYLSSQPKDGLDALNPVDGKQSVWQLPPQRRTLDMAREHIKDEQEAIREQRQAVHVEKEALEEGAKIWRDVAAQVTDFEKRLRAEMAGEAPTLSESHSAWDDATHTNPNERIKDLMMQLHRLIESLESHFNLAEERNWRLLIAAIGAELDALRRGKQILDGVTGTTSEQEDDLVLTAAQQSHSPARNALESHSTDKSLEIEHRHELNDGDGRRSDTDDEPDPELLFSRQDTD